MAEQFVVRGISGKQTMSAAAYNEYQQGLARRKAAGRYTLEEAAMTLCEATGERAAEMLAKFMAAAFAGDLPTYEPGKHARYLYGDNFASRVRDFYEEARWEDLNKWLSKNEPFIEFEFPDPDEIAPPAEGEPVKGLSKQAVINAFDGLHFSRDRWSKALADPPDWLEICRVMRGRKGDRSASGTWDPVLIAAALSGRKISMKELDAVFVDLAEWADEWREKSASFRK